MNVELKRDGLILRGELVLPEKDSYDIAILMHGFTGNRNGELLTGLADTLLKKGVSSVRFDFNGHGESDGKLEEMTMFNELADAKAILDYVRALKNVRNIYLVGHSQGGVVASMIAGYYPEFFKKVVLMAPAATLKDDAIKGECQGTSYDPVRIPDKIIVNGNTISGFYFRIAQTLPIYEVASRYTGEVLMLHGDCDTIVDKIASERYHDVYQNGHLHIVKGGDHGFGPRMQQEAIQAAADFICADKCK